VAATHTEDGHK